MGKQPTGEVLMVRKLQLVKTLLAMRRRKKLSTVVLAKRLKLDAKSGCHWVLDRLRELQAYKLAKPISPRRWALSPDATEARMCSVLKLPLPAAPERPVKPASTPTPAALPTGATSAADVKDRVGNLSLLARKARAYDALVAYLGAEDVKALLYMTKVEMP